MRARSYVFTFNNPPDELFNNDDALDAWLHGLGGKYSVAGRENAPTSGTPHLQGYIQFANPRSVAAVRKLIAGCHVEIAKGSPIQCRKYCVKDGNFVECGESPQDPGEREKLRWENARTLAKEGNFDDIPADIYIRYIGNLERIHRKTLPPLESQPATCGIWLNGPTGVGKSRGARQRFPTLYPKPLNKWWDGYDGQPTVLIDDLDYGQSSWIGNFLKIWSDHYPFIAEMKGGSRLIRPERIIVTSQYLIKDIFNDEEMRSALERRFQIVQVIADKEIDWPRD